MTGYSNRYLPALPLYSQYSTNSIPLDPILLLQHHLRPLFLNALSDGQLFLLNYQKLKMVPER
jgi:hypothetical protein